MTEGRGSRRRSVRSEGSLKVESDREDHLREGGTKGWCRASGGGGGWWRGGRAVGGGKRGAGLWMGGGVMGAIWGMVGGVVRGDLWVVL